jgi:hypothetical protein
MRFLKYNFLHVDIEQLVKIFGSISLQDEQEIALKEHTFFLIGQMDM